MAILQRSFFGVKPGRKQRVAPKGKKICAQCDKAKAFRQFGRRTNAPDGLSFYCRECIAEQSRASREERKAASWKRHYGISEQAYWDLFERQAGVCAICCKPETWAHKGVLAHLSVDHDHVTGRVRGLLCRHCNHGLGRFFDQPECLERAAAYLKGGV